MARGNLNWIFIRHPAVAVAPGICYGHSDVALQAPATATLPALLQKLEQRAPNATIAPLQQIHSSPSQRCVSMARLLSAELNLPLHIDERLKEMDFGAWEMQAWDAIPRQDLDAWAADIAGARPHGGESPSMLVHRVHDWFQEWQTPLASATQLVITHAGVIRLLCAHLTGKSLDHYLRTPLDFNGLCHLQRAPDGAPQPENAITTAAAAEAAEAASHWSIKQWNA